jgi:hypothetical protein
MKGYSENLLQEVEVQLKAIHSKAKNPIQEAEMAIKYMVLIMEKLKSAVLLHSFPNKAEEMFFFRNLKPKLAARLIYFNDIYTIQTNKPIGNKKEIRKFFNRELAKLNTYFEENIEFYRYLRTGNHSLDKQYFLRSKSNIKHTLDSFYYQADQRFSTSHDYKVAKIKANEELRMYLETEIANLDQNEQNKFPFSGTKKQQWTAPKVALIELIYALHTEGVFNNGDSELKEVITFFEAVLEVDLGQFNRTFLEIRNRKSERTKFLTTLTTKLILRMEDADENQ